jgi:hypothetical protein
MPRYVRTKRAMKLFTITFLWMALLGFPLARCSAQQQQPPAPPANPAPVTKVKTKVNTKVDTKVKVKQKADIDLDEDPDLDEDSEKVEGQSEQTVATTPTVSVKFCGISSSVNVRGWDRNEVHVTISDNEKLDLNFSNDGGKGAPASRIEVRTKNSIGQLNHQGYCQSQGDLQLDVPRGAVLDLTTTQGEINVENVARVHAVSNNGSIGLRGITKAIEATSFNGEIEIARSHGPVNLTSISGSIDVRDTSPLDSWDGLTISSVSGEVMVSDSNFAQVRANSVSGELYWKGDLAKGGSYQFISTNADITMVMPASVSFRVDARMANQGALNTEFKLKSEGETSLNELKQHVAGTYGGGSAQVNLTTFSGTLTLRQAKK